MAPLSIAIMGHPARQRFIDELVDELPEAEVVLDRHNDRWDTGRRALQAADPAAAHHVVVQDDAILCRDFAAGAAAVCAAAGERPVGFYAGRPRPVAGKIAAAVRMAKQARRPWLAMEGPIWGVAIAVPTASIDDLIAWGDRHPEIPNYDMRISRYFQGRGIRCWYTVPSLVDHRPVAENPSLIGGRTADRRAHWFIGTERSPLDIDWSPPPLGRLDLTPRPRLRRANRMAQKRIADRRIYGLNRHGREVLIAAKGQPIPAGYDDVAPPKTRAAKTETYTRSPATDADPRVELSALKRAELNTRARAAGVEAPDKLPNKGAVIEAIVERL